MRIPALVATILILTTGCDKANQPKWVQDVVKGYQDFIDRVSGVAEATKPPPPVYTKLDGKPTVLFQVFGKRSDPRIIPIAVLERGKLNRIVLTGRGWRDFDRLYASPGETLALYQDGRRVGTATVRQGMWQAGDSALYTLPGCRLALPIATVALRGDVAGRTTVELLASSNGTLGRNPEPVAMSPAQVEKTARDIGLLVGARLSISPRTLDSLEFRAIAVPTGQRGRPTLVVNYLDAAATDSTKNRTARQVLFFADQGQFGYGSTYWHFQRGRNPAPQFRRYLDHLDLDGDGQDEIILEAWNAMRPGTFYMVLRRQNGMWEERYRSDPEWCLDAQQGQLAAAEAR